MATKYYGINDKWTDDDIENVIEIASEDGTVDSVKVNGVEYGGGGGGAPFYKLTIRVTPTTEGNSINIGGTMASEYGPSDIAFSVLEDDESVLTLQGVSVFEPKDVVFYVYNQYAYPFYMFCREIMNGISGYSVTGGLEFVEDSENPGSYYLKVTGDGSISGPGTGGGD